MTIITTTHDLSEVCRLIEDTGRFGLDLEFIPERTYTAELCLIQVSTDQDAFIIDPVVMQDLDPLWQLVASPKVLTVLHAAEQDLDIIYTDCGQLPQNILDTQIAAGFLGFGYPVGYSKLLQQTLSITISKTESYTDWLARPLSKSQIEYALDDVRHLLPMYDKLVDRLNKLGRAPWVEQECQRYSDPKYYEKDRSNEFFRIKGANSLTRRGLAVLRELSDWRRQEASRSNRPLKSILQDGILLEFARRPPAKASDLQRIRGFRPDQLRQYGTALMEAIKTGQAVPDSELPKWPAAKVPTRQEILTADVLYTVLRVICFDLDMAPELVATRSILEALVRQHGEGTATSDSLPVLSGWRYDIAGQQLMALLNGAVLEMQFRQADHPVRMKLEPNHKE
jgi:ribonuclease D